MVALHVSMQIKMMNYELQLLKTFLSAPDSVFQEGAQCLLYANCEIQETDSSYVVSFRPDHFEEKISFDFLGTNLFISGESHPEFKVGVSFGSDKIGAEYVGDCLQLVLPKSSCHGLML